MLTLCIYNDAFSCLHVFCKAQAYTNTYMRTYAHYFNNFDSRKIRVTKDFLERLRKSGSVCIVVYVTPSGVKACDFHSISG
jgi:hypothetical protein